MITKLFAEAGRKIEICVFLFGKSLVGKSLIEKTKVENHFFDVFLDVEMQVTHGYHKNISEKKS